MAVSNSARSTVLSGDPEALDRILAALEAARGLLPPGQGGRRVAQPAGRAAARPSSSTGLGDLGAGIRPRAHLLDGARRRSSGARPSGPRYWARNLREPVRFAAAVQALVADGHDTFIEMGPHPVLVGAIQQELSGRARPVALPVPRRDQDEQTILLESLGALSRERRRGGLGPALSRRDAWCRCPPMRGSGSASGSRASSPRRLAAGGSPRHRRRMRRRAVWSPDDGCEVLEVVWREAALARAAPVHGCAPGADLTSTDPWLSPSRMPYGSGASVVRVAPKHVPRRGWRVGGRRAMEGDLSRCTGIVDLYSLSGARLRGRRRGLPREVSGASIPGLLALIRALAGGRGGRSPRASTWSRRGTQAVTRGAESTSPAAGLLVGLGPGDRMRSTPSFGARTSTWRLADAAAGFGALATSC